VRDDCGDVVMMTPDECEAAMLREEIAALRVACRDLVNEAVKLRFEDGWGIPDWAFQKFIAAIGEKS
jgi:hypothetical protein